MPSRRSLLFSLLAMLAVAAVVWTILSATQHDTVVPAAPPVGTELPVAPADRESPTEAPDRSLATSAEADTTTVRGRVVDAYGEGAPGAFVGETTEDRPTTTLGDGTFELTVARGPATTTLLVLAPGHAPLLSSQEVPDGVVVDIGELQLQRGGELRGRVTDEAGNALPGAMAALRLLSSGTPGVDVDRLHTPKLIGADGGYAFVNLAPGSYRVAASAAGRQAALSAVLTVRDGAPTLVDPLLLPPGHVLAGIVVDPAGAPVAAALVRVRLRSQQARFDGSAETSADGRFRLEALPAGPLQIEVEKSGLLRGELTGVDAARGKEVVVQLAAGLRVTGVAVDARTGLPVERFAAWIRRLGDVAPATNGTVPQQLRRQIETSRAAASTATDAAQRALHLQLATEFEVRLARIEREAVGRPLPVPADLGPVSDRPQGRFQFEGLEQGLYAIGIQSPLHQWAQQEPVTVQVGLATPDLRLALVAGDIVNGVVVVGTSGAPVRGATVELVSPADVAAVDAAAEESQRSLFPWLFARMPRRGVAVMTVQSGDGGNFRFSQAPPGRYVVAVRHPDFDDFDSAEFTTAGGHELRIEIAERATLVGRVGNVPATMRGKVSVLVLGGHGTMHTVKVAADDTWRCAGLQSGSYLVRAFPTESKDYVRRLLGELFPESAADVDPDRVPPRDVTVVSGETRTFDVQLDLPPAGSVRGQVTIDNAPGRGVWIVLRPVAGEAPGSGGLSLRGKADDAGSFTIADVPAGNYKLVVLDAARWQELHNEAVAIAAGEVHVAVLVVAAGGLHGRVTAPDVAPADELRGYLWVLPGASEAPADLYGYRKEHRTHRVSVQNGAYEEKALTPGPAVVLIDLRGRQRTVAKVVVPASGVLAVDFAAGARLP